MRRLGVGPMSLAILFKIIINFNILLFYNNNILGAAVHANSVQHISTNSFGDLFGVAGLKKMDMRCQGC